MEDYPARGGLYLIRLITIEGNSQAFRRVAFEYASSMAAEAAATICYILWGCAVGEFSRLYYYSSNKENEAKIYL